MAYEFTKLPYSFSALEPYIDAQTVEIHYTKHHQGYLDKLNMAIAGKPELEKYPLEELLSKLVTLVPTDIQTTVRNTAGGVVNHNLYWETMIPGGSTAPTKELGKAITKKWSDVNTFTQQLSERALAHFGSGWAWLVLTGNKELEITTTANQDSPFLTGNKPLLGIDVWEHAYYLKYQNKRVDYIQAWWKLVNWDVVEQYYQKSLS